MNMVSTNEKAITVQLWEYVKREYPIGKYVDYRGLTRSGCTIEERNHAFRWYLSILTRFGTFDGMTVGTWIQYTIENK